MTEHTKEPWQTWGSVNNGACYIVPNPFLGKGNIALFTKPEDAARATAAVNACAGIPTEALEAGVIGEMRTALERIADKRNIHFAGDAQVVAANALSRLEASDMTDRNEARALAAMLDAYADKWNEPETSGLPAREASATILALAEKVEQQATHIAAQAQDIMTLSAALATATEALREAIEFADQDAQALTPAGERMIARWRTALAKIEAGTAEHPDSAKLREAVDLLRELHDTHVSAFPAVANLGPIARTRAFLAKVEEGGTNGK